MYSRIRSGDEFVDINIGGVLEEIVDRYINSGTCDVADINRRVFGLMMDRDVLILKNFHDVTGDDYVMNLFIILEIYQLRYCVNYSANDLIDNLNVFLAVVGDKERVSMELKRLREGEEAEMPITVIDDSTDSSQGWTRAKAREGGILVKLNDVEALSRGCFITAEELEELGFVPKE